MRLAILAAAFSVTASAQDAEDRTRRPTDEPVIEFLPAPFRTVTPERPELIAPVETEARAGAVVRQLDKMTGATRTVEIPAGGTVELGRLTIAAAACVAPASGAAEGTRAFLQIWDRAGQGSGPRFSGWMFAESPALSALDHPRFDVWVISCTTS